MTNDELATRVMQLEQELADSKEKERRLIDTVEGNKRNLAKCKKQRLYHQQQTAKQGDKVQMWKHRALSSEKYCEDLERKIKRMEGRDNV